MGNFHGFNIFDMSNPDKPELAVSVACPGGQGDVSVKGDLLFMSVEQGRARLDCGSGGVEGESSAERFKGVRIFDISDLSAPRQVAAVQTCRGSHTHTLVPHPDNDDIVYIYVSGTGSVRPESELSICSDGEPGDNPDTARYSIDIIEVDLNRPEAAKIVNRPRIFSDYETGEIAGLWPGGSSGENTQRTASTDRCHDITAYPEMGLAAGACSGNGILLDITDPASPVRIGAAFDGNMVFWHSATFSNDAQSIVFTDEWGGGLGARCTPEAPENWGANIIVTRDGGEMGKRAFYKIPGVQSAVENCVAHNGNLIPVPGRDLMVQAWYSGGLSVMDFTDPDNPFEIAYFDRGPVDPERLLLAGYWGTYWHNGRIYGAEIARGLDVFALKPGPHLSTAEIEAAESVMLAEANTQTQDHFEWTPSPVVARAYLDQLTRAGAIDVGLTRHVNGAIADWRRGREMDEARRIALITDLRQAGAASGGVNAERFNALAELLGEI